MREIGARRCQNDKKKARDSSKGGRGADHRWSKGWWASGNACVGEEVEMDGTGYQEGEEYPTLGLIAQGLRKCAEI